MNIDTEIEVERWRTRALAAEMTVISLRAQLGDDVPTAMSWLQRKTSAQATALSRLQERVVNQRFVLRNVNRLGRGLSDDELATARALESDTVTVAAA
jgi:hypothetical protein